MAAEKEESLSFGEVTWYVASAPEYIGSLNWIRVINSNFLNRDLKLDMG